MDSSAVVSEEPPWTTRERPWLVSWNRKLRHLRSVTVRNLNLSPAAVRPRTRSNDDEALPHSLKSPAKLLALQEEAALNHSRSSEDLRQATKVNGLQKVSSREKHVRPGRLRRQSTLDWAHASPQSRQKRMEHVSATKLADVFFSLHVPRIKSPVYVSERINKTMNPSFQNIDLGECGPDVLRSDTVTLKLWIHASGQKDFRMLLEMSLSLRSLQFIGRSVAAFDHPLPQNCILFELSDGYYTCFTDAQSEERSNPFQETRAKLPGPRTLPCASFDALLRLSKLDDSIQDALALRKRLSLDLSSLADASRQPLLQKDQVHESRDYLKTIDYAKSTVAKQLKTLRQSCESKRAALQKRRDLLSQGRTEIAEGVSNSEKAEEDVSQVRADIVRTKHSITNQRRRICADLGAIYPIAAIPDKSLAFTIRGIHLPDSEALEATPPEQLAAALGYVAHMLQLLSFYLRHPLPYPPHPRLSSSIMTDPISNLKQATTGSASTSPFPRAAPRSLSDPSRSFSLNPKSSGPRYRFEYALFLLNKDLHVLLSDAFEVRVLDVRQTLPNLMYVLACMEAGEGELPSRKAGGIRGLMKTSTAKSEGRVGLGLLGSVAMKEVGLAAAATLTGAQDGNEEMGFKEGLKKSTLRNMYKR